MAEENLTKGKEDRVGDGGGGEIEKKKEGKHTYDMIQQSTHN